MVEEPPTSRKPRTLEATSPGMESRDMVPGEVVEDTVDADANAEQQRSDLLARNMSAIHIDVRIVFLSN
jgi:hypothetical protein